MRIREWLLATRPKTLTAAIVPVVVGTTLAASEGFGIEWSWFALTLGSALFIQVGTNFVNDAIDFRKGTDTAQRIGPLRVTQAGLISDRAVMRGAFFCFATAMLLGLPLVMRGGLPLLVIGLASIACAYGYTGGPYPLAYNGLGDLFVIVFFGLIAVGGTFYLQTLTYDRFAFVAGLCVGCLATVLLAVNNLRDIEGDAISGKRTLAVRLGRRAAQLEIALFALAPFAAASVWLLEGRPLAFLLPLLSLPFAVLVIRSSLRDRGPALNATLAKSAALHAAFGALFSIGVLLG